MQTTVQQLLIARPDNHLFRDFSLPHLHSTTPLGGGVPVGVLPSRLVRKNYNGVATRR